MVVLKGKQKNQTKKSKYTIVIIGEDGYVIDRKVVEAENAREAVKLAYSNIFNS